MNLSRRIFLFFLLALSNPSFAYRENTHRDLSGAAVNISALSANQSLLTDFGLLPFEREQRFLNPSDPGGNKILIEELFRNGAGFEDGGTRSVNHFYNPVTNQGLSVGNASPDWTLEDVNDIPEQAYSYNDAMRFFYLALTSQTEDERELNWAKTFQTLGQVIHHVQDMAQPAHARNDLHCDAIPCLITLGLYDPSWYEQYTDDHKADTYFKSLMTANGYPIPTFDTAREFWTTRASDASTMDRRGMADYTNRNFVSKDTIFQLHGGAIIPHSEYPYPEPDVTPVTVNIADPDIKGAQGQAVCDSIKARSIIPFPDSACYMDFISTPVNDAFTGSSSTNDRAATYSIFDKKLLDHNIDAIYIREDGSVDTVDRSFTLNEFNFKAAHNYLIPRAVAYSAGLINHFFRGKIDMIPRARGDGLIIKNLSDEEMQGIFTLYYHRLDEADGLVKRVPVTDASWSLVIGPNSEQVVAPYVMPEDIIREEGLILVFTGNMGVEYTHVVTGTIMSDIPYSEYEFECINHAKTVVPPPESINTGTFTRTRWYGKSVENNIYVLNGYLTNTYNSSIEINAEYFSFPQYTGDGNGNRFLGVYNGVYIKTSGSVTDTVEFTVPEDSPVYPLSETYPRIDVYFDKYVVNSELEREISLYLLASPNNSYPIPDFACDLEEDNIYINRSEISNNVRYIYFDNMSDDVFTRICEKISRCILGDTLFPVGP